MNTLDETHIATLVDRFYEKVRVDPLLGPVFNAAVHDWVAHKALLTRFWCSVVLRAQSYRGNPLGVHREQPAIRTEHFVRWLELWRVTTREVMDTEAADEMDAFAQRIGRGMSMGMGLAPPRDARQPFGLPVMRTTQA